MFKEFIRFLKTEKAYYHFKKGVLSNDGNITFRNGIIYFTNNIENDGIYIPPRTFVSAAFLWSTVYPYKDYWVAIHRKWTEKLNNK